MAIIRWRPFHDIEKFFENNFHSHHADLAVDLYEEKDAIIAHVHVPGIDPDKIDISVEDHALKISGSREEEKETEDKNYYYKEIQRGDFERVITLPTAVIPEKTRAEFKDGVLKIYLPKKSGSNDK
jgi:HSP20 family protein